EEGKEIVRIHGLSGDLGEAEQDALEQAVEAQEGAGQEGQIAQGEGAGYGAPDDEGIGGVIGETRNAGKERAPGGAQDGDAAVFEENLPGQGAEPVDEVIAQAEELDLLGGFGAGPDMAEIFDLAPLGRAPAAEHIGQGIEAGLAPDGGD